MGGAHRDREKTLENVRDSIKKNLEYFENFSDMNIDHVHLAKNSDLIIIAPITANSIAKISHGITDDPITGTISASKSPVILAPAMDAEMYENNVSKNLKSLDKNRFCILEPQIGRLASGITGINKIKKNPKENNFNIELEKTSDIIKQLKNKNITKIAFAAETENIIENAKIKLKEKNLDMIIANDVSREDIGFNSDNNQVTLIQKNGSITELPVMPKTELAHILLDETISLIS